MHVFVLDCMLLCQFVRLSSDRVSDRPLSVRMSVRTLKCMYESVVCMHVYDIPDFFFRPSVCQSMHAYEKVCMFVHVLCPLYCMHLCMFYFSLCL